MQSTPSKNLRRLERSSKGSWRDLFVAPSDQLWEVARRNEWTIALLRLVLMTGVVTTTTVLALWRPDAAPSLATHLLAWGAWLTAVGLLALAGRQWSPRIAGILSTQLDIAWITLVLLVGGLVGNVFSSGVSWLPAAYVVAVAASTLRLDSRVSLLAGAAAMVQYSLVIALTMARPIQFPGLAVASFTYTSPTGHLAHLTAQLAVTVIALLAIAGMNRLAQHSTVDRLTGLFGQRFFLDRLGEKIAQSDRSPEPFTVGLIELELARAARAKLAVGHVLRAAADLLAQRFRAGDTVARLDGTRFAVLMHNYDQDSAAKRFDETCSELERLPIDVKGRMKTFQFRAVAGVAASSEPNCEPWKALGLATQRLASTRSSCRDRVIGPSTSPRAVEATTGTALNVRFTAPAGIDPARITGSSPG